MRIAKVVGLYELTNTLNAAAISMVRLVKNGQSWTFEISAAA
jgi:hypothetical protein